MVKRENVLQEAMDLIAGDRQAAYGDAKASFERIAAMYSAWKGQEMTATDAAVFFILAKVSRAHTSPDRVDNWVDICGYAALAAEGACDGKDR